MEGETIPCGLCGRDTYQYGTKLCDRCWELKQRIESNPTLARAILAGLGEGYILTKDGAAAVDPDYYWRDIDEHTPRGVKLQLLTAWGVAIYSIYNGSTDIVGWAPLPKRRKQ